MALDLNQNDGGGKDFGRVEDGSYPARVAQIVDLGRQQETAWIDGKAVPQYYVEGEDGKAVKNDDGYAKKTSKVTSMPCIQPKVFITFELPTETIEIEDEELPRWISKEYNVTSKGALYKLVTSLKADATKISEIVGLPCMVTVGSTGSGNAKVSAVGPLMKGVKVDELRKEPVVFDMSSPDLEVYNNLPDFLKDKIKSGPDYAKSELKRMLESSPESEAEEDFDQDIPF